MGGSLTDDEFSAAIGEHRRGMFRFAMTLAAPDDAEDLVQNALTRAWHKRGQFQPSRGSLQSWLLAIVADQARGRWRRARPVEEQIDPDLLRQPPPDERGVDVRGEVAALPPRQRAAVVLHYFVDLPIGEVASLMRCSPGTVKSTLHDARAQLGRTLGESYVQS